MLRVGGIVDASHDVFCYLDGSPAWSSFAEREAGARQELDVEERQSRVVGDPPLLLSCEKRVHVARAAVQVRRPGHRPVSGFVGDFHEDVVQLFPCIGHAGVGAGANEGVRALVVL